MGPATGLVASSRAKQGGAEVADPALKVGSRISLVADDRLAAGKRRAQQGLGHLTLAEVGRGQRPGTRRAVGAEGACKRMPQKCREWLVQ